MNNKMMEYDDMSLDIRAKEHSNNIGIIYIYFVSLVLMPKRFSLGFVL